MTKPKISLDQFTAALAQYRGSRKRNAKQPGEVAGCTYVIRDMDGKPLPDVEKRHCAIGRVMNDLGVLVPDECEGLQADAALDLKVIRGRFLKTDLDPIITLAAFVQGHADNGVPWGVVLLTPSRRPDRFGT